MPKKTKTEQFLATALGSSGKLSSLILLIDRAMVLIKEMEHTPALRVEHSRKVRNILAQLQMALNFQTGDVTRSLFFLYDFLYEEMTVADDRALASALTLLTQLRDTFTTLKRRGS